MNLGEGGSVLRLRLPLRRTSARALRTSLARYLAEGGVPRDAADDVLLAADEAYINAFMHSGVVEGEVEVRAEVRAGRVFVEISDGGCGYEPGSRDVWSQPDPLNSHGRGLFLIYHLMDDVHVRSREAGRRGTSVRMIKELRRRRPPAARSAT
ncbi:MAG: ATP-binding protein [Thermoleophilia bacterium]